MGFIVSIYDKGRFLYEEYAATLEAARGIYGTKAEQARESNLDAILDAEDTGAAVDYKWIQLIGYTVRRADEAAA